MYGVVVIADAVFAALLFELLWVVFVSHVDDLCDTCKLQGFPIGLRCVVRHLLSDYSVAREFPPVGVRKKVS